MIEFFSQLPRILQEIKGMHAQFSQEVMVQLTEGK